MARAKSETATRRTAAKRITILAAFSCMTAPLWATRGPEDFGLALGLVAVFFSIPSGILLVCVIIYSFVWLRKRETPVTKRGSVVFIVSLVIMALSVLIGVLFMRYGKWHPTMIQVMLGACVPVFLLGAFSAALAHRLTKRS